MKNKKLRSKVAKHLKGDIKGYMKEAAEDVALLKQIKKDRMRRSKSPNMHEAFEVGVEMGEHKEGRKLRKRNEKIRDVMHEFKEGTLRSGSKKGPKVKSRKQALAIGFSEARKSRRKRK